MDWFIEWGIGIVVVGFLYYRFFLVKNGDLGFWKIAGANPEEAYSFFSQSDNFIVFDSKPQNGYRANLPDGDWDGPFRLHVPSRKGFVVVYGKAPEYESEQNLFAEKFNG